MSTLLSTVSEELQPVLLQKEYFLESLKALSAACGQTSMVTLCQRLFDLLNLTYDPNNSLENHAYKLTDLFRSFQNCAVGNTFQMDIGEGAAAAILLMSIGQDSSLTGLVQTLYYATPFNLEQITSRLLIEDSRRTKKIPDSTLYLSQSKPLYQPPHLNHSSTSRFTKPSSTTRGHPRPHPSGATPTRLNQGANLEEKFKVFLDKYMKEYFANSHSANQAEEEIHNNRTTEELTEYDDGFYVQEDAHDQLKLMSISSKNNTELIHDSGASQSTVCNLALLTNPQPTKITMQTFSGIIEVTLMGKLNLGGYKLYPVYYAPQGRSDLISASQLEDHGLRSYQKNQTIIVKSGNRIVQTFPRKGNLYVSQFQPSTNSIIKDSTTTTSRDWHVILGHPSNEYLKRFLHLNDLKQSVPLNVTSNCHICKSCKIKASPHNHPISSADQPFKKLHFDILEITPLAKNSIRYVLVIIDDFSQFNQVYLLNQKSQAALKLMSYIHEIQNKIQRCPGFLQTNRGGDFYSTSFRSKTEALGIVFERGPANSPQTNGVVERFNQTLLTKCWCLLVQSNVPIRFWDEAIELSSTLINLLPSCSLNWKSPAFVRRQPESKVLPPSKPLLYLGPEDYSDASRFLDPQAGKNNIPPTNPTITDDQSPPTPIPSSEPTITINSEPNQTPIEPCTTISSPSCIPLPHKKGYAYVPHYCNAPKDINRDNIITEPRRQRNVPKAVTPPPAEDGDLYLNEEVSVKQAFQDPKERKFWNESMDQEFESLTSKNTGTLVPPPSTDKFICGMWQLLHKKNEFGEILKYKARWVCFGNHQEHLVNYYDTYAAVARSESFKILLSLMVDRKFLAYQFNIETPFLHGEMDAPNYVSQVANYEVPADTDKCLFFNTNRTLFLHIHVDDGLIIGETAELVKLFLTQLRKSYSIKTKEQQTQHLGHTLSWQLNGSVILHQQDFCSKILEQFNMTLANPIRTPAPANIHNVVAQASVPFSNLTMQKAIGMLNYLALRTKPDIMFTTNLVAQFTNRPTAAHWSLVKHLLRYLNGTRFLGLHFTRTKHPESELVGWADADYATSLVAKKSHSGYVIMFLGNPVSWTTKKQPVVAQSTTKAEFILMNKCSKEMQWLSNLLYTLNMKLKVPVLKNDNTGAITISEEAQLNPNSNHIELRFQYLRDLVKKNLLIVQHSPTNDMVADVLTKAFGTVKNHQAIKLLNTSHAKPVLNPAVRPSSSQQPRNSPITTSRHLQPVASSRRRRDGLSPLLFPAAQVFQRRDCLPIQITREDPNAESENQDAVARLFRRVDRNSREVIMYANDRTIPGTASEEMAAKSACYDDELINDFQRTFDDLG
ncbi:hypothetical protein O181_043849 [Austropuccinia psidii MF-1]|uniref:Integrase catalytic domain-containing protein n=1 Tax=Austropuccinia psidii MF-1 TaxID=1389203 RepID=A0A9Q3DJ61_9BASI|nr:hypothetical protein [Austropuccinia psidii MF-1]